MGVVAVPPSQDPSGAAAETAYGRHQTCLLQGRRPLHLDAPLLVHNTLASLSPPDPDWYTTGFHMH